MPKVLVVDDSQVDRVLVDGILKRGRDFVTQLAENGAQALEMIPRFGPDVIVTDLQMPEMDGLRLVTAVKVNFPNVPVVLVTAHGSEKLAVEALEQGASSYVPKSQLREKLLDVVRQVVDLARADQSYERLTQRMTFADFRFSLDYDPTVHQRLIELFQQISLNMGVCDIGGQIRVGMAIEESLKVMTLLGNLELTPEQCQNAVMGKEDALEFIEQRKADPRFRDRRLDVSCSISPDEARFGVQHAGTPFSASILSEFSNHSPALESGLHRSVVLMNAFMDHVTFQPNGVEVILVKHRDEKPKRSSAA